MTDLFSNEVISQLTKELKEVLNGVDKLKRQLKAKEQECEAYKMEADEGKEINAELKAELTRANCQIADDEILQCDMREAIEELKAENDELKNRVAELSLFQLYKIQRDEAEKALIEIKEIIQNQGHIDILEEQILQKINECGVMDE